MTIDILKYLFLFYSGALLGWGIEVLYRRFFGKARAWINPGFLSGPYLPLYGIGVCLLYIVSDLNIALWLKIALFALTTTLIEYFTGLFFFKFYKTRLWDYREVKLNVQGIIAPLYSLFWTLLSLIFYYILYPYFYGKIEFLYEHLEFSLFVGIFYGVILVDFVNSFNIVGRIKKAIELAEDSKEAINLEHLKIDIKTRLNELKIKRRPSYLLPFKGNFELKEHLKGYLQRRKR